MVKGIKGFQPINKNPMWRGDDVGYSAVHEWIKKYFPKPQLCNECKKEKPYDLANISQTYKRDISDWEWLCRKYHMKKDGRLKNIIKYGKSCYGKPRAPFSSETIKLFKKIASNRKRNKNGQFC